MKTLTIDLPDNLAKEAKRVGPQYRSAEAHRRKLCTGPEHSSAAAGQGHTEVLRLAGMAAGALASEFRSVSGAQRCSHPGAYAAHP